MKNLWKKIAAVSTAAVMCAGIGILGGCAKGDTGATGPQGPQGIQGVQGEQGKAGANGTTPHIGNNGNWFIGTTDTGVKAQGTNGTNGTNGNDGTTPHIGTNGNWFIGTTDTGVKAQGTNGTNGTNGNDGVTPHIGANGNWYIGTTDTGVKAQGANGTDGTNGTNGTNGVTPHIGANGNWYIGTTDTGVKAEGKDGKNPTVTIEDGYWVIDGVATDTKAEGVMGTVWFTGKGLPDNAANAENLQTSKAGDFYVNTYTNTIYIKSESGAWSVLVNVNEQNNVSTWDGRIPGWQAPNLSEEQIKANRPVSYVVNEDAYTVDIYNAEAFAWFAYRSVIGVQGYEGWTVTLHCDVDLANHMWVPIGLGARSNAQGVAFKGTFDGNGHTIYNMNGTAFFNAIEYGDYDNILGVSEPTKATGYYVPYTNGTVSANIPVVALEDGEMPFGLFATTKDATIKNLNVQGVKLDLGARLPEGATAVSGKQYALLTDSVGSVVGYAHGNLTLENVTAGNPEGGDYIKGAQCAAGIVGRAYAGSGDDGKIAPYGSIKIKNCVNYIDVTGVQKSDELITATNNDKSGGIISFPRWYSSMEVTDCVNYGRIHSHFAGGIVGTRQGTGAMASPSKILNCVNYGEIVALYAGGGIIGYRTVADQGSKAPYIIANCANYGNLSSDISYSNGAYLGGIAGWFQVTSAQAIFINCMNFGDINLAENSVAGRTLYGGGVFGVLRFVKDGTGSVSIANCINSGNFNLPATATFTPADYCFGQLKKDCVSTNAGTNINAADMNEQVFKEIGLTISGYVNLGKNIYVAA